MISTNHEHPEKQKRHETSDNQPSPVLIAIALFFPTIAIIGLISIGWFILAS